MSQFRSIKQIGATVAIVVPLLAACGGGGGDSTDTSASAATPAPKTPAFTQIATYTAAVQSGTDTYLINPSATWKLFASAADGNVGSVATLDLSKLVPAGTALAGTTFEVRTLGTYDATSTSGTQMIMRDLSAVFVDSTGATIPLPASATLAPATRSSCNDLSGPNDPFAGDFLIPFDAVGRVTVPAGAVQLRLSVDDCYFNDNVTTAADPLRISIKIATP